MRALKEYNIEDQGTNTTTINDDTHVAPLPTWQDGNFIKVIQCIIYNNLIILSFHKNNTMYNIQ